MNLYLVRIWMVMFYFYKRAMAVLLSYRTFAGSGDSGYHNARLVKAYRAGTL